MSIGFYEISFVFVKLLNFIRRGMIMKFNERLKSIREEKGLTQQQLSDRSGVSVRTIQNYESGSYSPRFGIVDFRHKKRPNFLNYVIENSV